MTVLLPLSGYKSICHSVSCPSSSELKSILPPIIFTPVVGRNILYYSTVRDSVINRCDRRIPLLSDSTDISFGQFNLFTYLDVPFG